MSEVQDNNTPPNNTGENSGLLARLKAPPKCSMLRMIVIGVLGGIIIWGGLNTGMEYTNRSEFCTSCHEMTIPFEELKKRSITRIAAAQPPSAPIAMSPAARRRPTTCSRPSRN